jgi:hypothetical protein
MHCCPDGTYAALPIVILCAGSPEATDDMVPDYIPPFVALQLEAVREFEISAENPDPPKQPLVNFFKGKGVSSRLAHAMATLVRSPAAMRGGKKGGD